MDPFVRRLIERLHEPGAPLSRNKHFHAFDNPLGKKALQVSKRLRALERDLATLAAAGHRAVATRVAGPGDEPAIELTLDFTELKGSRRARLSEDELEILSAMPGAAGAIDRSRL